MARQVTGWYLTIPWDSRLLSAKIYLRLLAWKGFASTSGRGIGRSPMYLTIGIALSKGWSESHVSIRTTPLNSIKHPTGTSGHIPKEIVQPGESDT